MSVHAALVNNGGMLSQFRAVLEAILQGQQLTIVSTTIIAILSLAL